MTRNKKKSKAVPVILVLTILLAALAVGCFLIRPMWLDRMNSDAKTEMEKQIAEIDEQNAAIQRAYQEEKDRLLNPPQTPTQDDDPSWPEHSAEGWDLVNLDGLPLKNISIAHHTRADVMNNGMLLINEWHPRPADFSETAIVSVGRHLGGNNRVQVQDYNVSLFPVAAEALLEAVTAAKEEGMEYYLVSEGYRTYEAQDAMFQKKVTQLSSKYSGTALTDAAKKEVSAPGTSEFNSGLAFTLRLYSKEDPEIGVPKYSTTKQAAWMNENCWKYGLIFRFPQADWPLAGMMDKSIKTGISLKLNLYRYVGKGNSTAMHLLDMCMEEYIEYLIAHPHIAIYLDGDLKYEIYRQDVGEAAEFDVLLTPSVSHVTSLDNMGGIITVFEF